LPFLDLAAAVDWYLDRSVLEPCRVDQPPVRCGLAAIVPCSNHPCAVTAVLLMRLLETHSPIAVSRALLCSAPPWLALPHRHIADLALPRRRGCRRCWKPPPPPNPRCPTPFYQRGGPKGKVEKRRRRHRHMGPLRQRDKRKRREGEEKGSVGRRRPVGPVRKLAC
jgi:hypothetical protein